MRRILRMSPSLAGLVRAQEPAKEYPIPGEFKGFEREEIAYELISYYRQEENGGREYMSFSRRVQVSWEPWLVESTGRVVLIPRLLPQGHTEYFGGVSKKFSLTGRVIRRLNLRRVHVELPEEAVVLPVPAWGGKDLSPYGCLLSEAKPMAAETGRQLKKILQKKGGERKCRRKTRTGANGARPNRSLSAKR